MFYSLSLDNDLHYNDKKMNHLFLLTLMLPLDYFIVSEIWLLYIRYSLERKLNKNENFLAINSPNLLTDLAHIDYAIFDKTGTITTNKKNLSLVYFKENDYIVEFDDYGHFLENLFKSKINKESYKKTMFLESKPNLALKTAKIVHCKHFIEELHCNESLNGLHDLLEAFAICNSIKIEFSKIKQRQKTNFRTKNEKFLFKFAKSLEYDFLNIYKKNNFSYYNVRIRNKILSYKILGVQELDQINQVLAMIYQDPQSKNYVICCKGFSSVLLKKLKITPEDKEIFDSIMKTFNQKGFLDPLMYAKKVLNPEDAESFYEKYKNLRSSLINQKDHLSDLISEFLYDLELVGLVALEEQLKADTYELIKFLKSMNINSWILTGDSKQNAYNVASRIAIFDDTAHQYCIESENHIELIQQLKNILLGLSSDIKPLIKDQKKKSKEMLRSRENLLLNENSKFKSQHSFLMTTVDEAYDKYILINGKSFELISQDEYLSSNFLFACSNMRTIIGYNFSPLNKKKFIDHIRQKFQKKATVLAVGDGYNDILMLNSANFGIEISKKSKNNKTVESNMMIGDLVLINLKQIKEIMINYSGTYFERYQEFTQITYFKSFIYGFSLFVFAFFDEFYSNCLYDPLLTLFYLGFFNVFSQALCLLYYEKIPSKIREDFIELYHEAKYQKKFRAISNSLFLLIFEAISISFIISIITFMTISEAVNSEGFSSNYNDLGFILAYSIVIFIHIKVIKKYLIIFLGNFNIFRLF